MTSMWAWFGYDEPNYTYTANGRKLLSALAAASPAPVYVRAHNLLTTGDGVAALNRHFWKPGDNYNDIYTGWAYPPTDYPKWGELIHQWVRHSVERYGRREVESWWWEVWNEPDIGYWRGTQDEYLKLYDYAADGLKRALPK
jgi:xylan 1,4-beta-xylosidase